jgi:hypothetical protein
MRLVCVQNHGAPMLQTELPFETVANGGFGEGKEEGSFPRLWTVIVLLWVYRRDAPSRSFSITSWSACLLHDRGRAILRVS